VAGNPRSDSGAGEMEKALREQAGAFSRLSAEDERALVARRGDPDAAEALVEHNLDLVVEQADRHRDRGLSFGDLYQEGTVGLIDAVAAYTGNGSFRQFASLHIGLQMDSLIDTEAAAREEDERLVADVRALDLLQTGFRARERRDPSDAEVARLLEWDEERAATVRIQLEDARRRNDELTLEFLDDAPDGELGVDFWTDEDHRRRLPGAGPDD
jgi:DNA-directed RNA polymerase sigma subunit (sigma70/sigma32)